MKKSEGLIALMEILETCKESLHVECISVDPQDGNDQDVCTIKLKCTFNDNAAECIKPILEKHQLAVREEQGYFFIFS
jgi:hypothetical protein